MISKKDVLFVHSVLIEKFGGQDGIRDLTLLESALNRPFATFDGKDLYPSSIEKAAAVLESIVINHPFIDGNKRTEYFLMRYILLSNNQDINATQIEKYDLVIAVAEGHLRIDEIKNWLSNHLLSVS